MSALYTRGQAAIIALALLSHTGSAAGWAMLDCLSTESFDSSVRGAAHRRIGRLGDGLHTSLPTPSLHTPLALAFTGAWRGVWAARRDRAHREHHRAGCQRCAHHRHAAALHSHRRVHGGGLPRGTHAPAVGAKGGGMFPSAGAPCGIVIWGAGRTVAGDPGTRRIHALRALRPSRQALRAMSDPRHCTRTDDRINDIGADLFVFS